MTVEDRASKRGALHRVAVTSPGHVSACENEFEWSRAGLAKNSDRTPVESTFPIGLLVVVFDLGHDLFRVFLAVQAVEDATDHGLLILGECLADSGLGDVPVVVDGLAQGGVEGKRHQFLLWLGQRLVELGDERFRCRFPDDFTCRRRFRQER